jgi:hypothetical protein
MQTTIFNPDGSVAELIATGLAANVQGEPLKDVGRVVWLPGTNEIVFAAGQHHVREAVEFGSFPGRAALVLQRPELSILKDPTSRRLGGLLRQPRPG